MIDQPPERVAPSAARRFAEELRRLYKAADSPDLATLVRQGRNQVPRVVLSDSTISDWLGGRSVPRGTSQLQFLVEFLEGRAKRRGGYTPRGTPSWEGLRREAWQQTHAHRGGRPRTRPDGPNGPVDPSSEPRRLGRPIDQCDAIALEVHPAIDVPAGGQKLSRLPGYVPRAHDQRLRQIADEVLEGGSSRLATLVGGSSTGKTRACWELAQYLEQRQPGRWRVWHPYDPTRPQAALADLEQVGACTIMWLNEAQHYLMPTDAVLGERIAAGLRTMLYDPSRAPVLILATVWPDYWNALTTRPTVGEPDRYAQARDVLAGTAVTVADAFTAGELALLTSPGADPRLRHAVEHADSGRITQYLAGAPELEARYRTAPPAARALIRVAMDARRLGHPLALSQALLEQAAPGYLDDHDWDNPGGDGQDWGEDWLEQALAYTTRPCKGSRGPLMRIRARSSRPDAEIEQPCYRLADYLEQIGRYERSGVYPPESLWKAFAAAVTDPALLRDLGGQAQKRGRYQHAIWLYIRAVDLGDAPALSNLAMLREQAGDSNAETLAVQAADRGDTSALTQLARLREEAGDHTGAQALYQRATDRGDIFAMWNLGELRERAGDHTGAQVLCQQAADRADIHALQFMSGRRQQVGDHTGALTLAVRAADRGDTTELLRQGFTAFMKGDTDRARALSQLAADRGDTNALRQLGLVRELSGDHAGAQVLYQQAADRGNIFAFKELARLREKAGDHTGAQALYRQGGDRGDRGALTELAKLREKAGDHTGAQALNQQATDRGDDLAAMHLVEKWEQDGDHTGAQKLAELAASRGHTNALEHLAELRQRIGDHAGARTLYQQAADYGSTHALANLARHQWHMAGDQESAEVLYQHAVDRGNPDALQELAQLREQTGDVAGAGRMRRFGLTGSGEIAAGLNFGS